jgi:hypothetical protein
MMATVTATGSWTAEFQFIPITGFLLYQEGILDPVSGTIKANGRGRWDQQTSWSTFTNYASSRDPIRWTGPLIDVGEIKYFTIAIETDFDGELSFRIHTSTTGSFSGEESEYIIEDGDFNVPAFFGRYVFVTAYVSGVELRRMIITTNSEKTTVYLSDVNTAELGGTVSNRILTLPNPASQIVDMKIEPKAASPYAVNLYVSDTATSEVLIPVVKSKSAAAPSFVLYGIDNDPRDGVVDVTLTTLPRQAMTGGNLLVVA